MKSEEKWKLWDNEEKWRTLQILNHPEVSSRCLLHLSCTYKVLKVSHKLNCSTHQQNCRAREPVDHSVGNQNPFWIEMTSWRWKAFYFRELTPHDNVLAAITKQVIIETFIFVLSCWKIFSSIKLNKFLLKQGIDKCGWYKGAPLNASFPRPFCQHPAEGEHAGWKKFEICAMREITFCVRRAKPAKCPSSATFGFYF